MIVIIEIIKLISKIYVNRVKMLSINLAFHVFQAKNNEVDNCSC